jgi:outer membrane protein
MFLKKYVSFLAIAFAFLISLTAQAKISSPTSPTPSSPSNALGNMRIGVVDVQAAILQTNEGKAAREKIEKEVSQKRQELLNQQNALKKMQEEFQSQQAVLSEADKQAKQKDFQAKVQAF